MDPVIPSMTNTRMITKVFVDTNIFVALKDDRDSTHKKALKLLEVLNEQEAKLYTSSDVIAESLTVISMKLGKGVIREFLKETGSTVKEIYISEEMHRETRNFFQRVKSKNISFVDCSSVIAMKRNKIGTIFSFDEDFKKLGVKLLSEIV